MQIEEQNQSSVGLEIASAAVSTPIKKQHGGKRSGAGRKPNIAKRLLLGTKPVTAAEALEGIDVRAVVHDLLKNGSRTVKLQTLTVLWGIFGKPKPTVDTIIRENEGKRHTLVFLSASLSPRAKVHAVISGGAPQEPRQKTQAQEVLEHATGRPHLEEALSVWGDPVRSWPRLYRILEEIEMHLD